MLPAVSRCCLRFAICGCASQQRRFPGLMGNPSGDLMQEARFVREDHVGSVSVIKTIAHSGYDELLRDPKLPITTGCWVLALRILPLSR